MIHDTPCAPPARCWSPEILEQELGRVHAREFARLLCRAALLRQAPRPRRARVLRTLGLEDDPVRWLRDAQRARALAEIDGYEPPGLLRHALAHSPVDWAPAARLLRAALALDASEATRWHAAAFEWSANGSQARAGLAELARNATRAAWRERAQFLLEQAEQAPW